MSTTSLRPAPPAPTCAPAYIGPCAGCGHPTHRYGSGGCPLCAVCIRGLEAWRSAK